jgi:hypothetical protein
MSTFYTILGLLLVSVAFLLGTMAEEKRRTTSGSQVETLGAGLGGAACGLGIAGGLCSGQVLTRTGDRCREERDLSRRYRTDGWRASVVGSAEEELVGRIGQ